LRRSRHRKDIVYMSRKRIDAKMLERRRRLFEKLTTILSKKLFIMQSNVVFLLELFVFGLNTRKMK